jgi:pimeloyl-ACP methyl ester carboxylesterase
MNQTISQQEGKTTGGIFYRRTFCSGFDADRKPTDDAQLHSQTHSHNPPHPTLVLVMGYGGSLRIWPETLITKLAERYDVITYDNRGTGQSFLPAKETDYTTKTMAEDLDSLATTLGLSHFHLLGYSMGGCIAIEYAHLFPDKVQSLFLLSTTGGGTLYVKPDKTMTQALANPQGKTLWEVYLYTFALMYSPQAFERVQPQLKAIYEMSKSCPTRPQALAGHSHAFKCFDASGYVANLTMPVTILSGADDRMMPAHNSRGLAQVLPLANLLIVPDCEHAVHIEQEDLVIREIEELTARAK